MRERREREREREREAKFPESYPRLVMAATDPARGYRSI